MVSFDLLLVPLFSFRRFLSPIIPPLIVAAKFISTFIIPKGAFRWSHWVYNIATSAIMSTIFFSIGGVSRADSVFLVVSAMTETGLNTLNLSDLFLGQQTVLFLSILLGGPQPFSWVVLTIRKRAWETHYTQIVLERQNENMIDSWVSARNEPPPLHTAYPYSLQSFPALVRSSFLSLRLIVAIRRHFKLLGLWRNAPFTSLSAAEKRLLVSREYKALCLLWVMVPLYWTAWQALGALGLGWYFSVNKADVIRENGSDPWWLGVFTAVSAFNNEGMSLMDLSMTPFQTATYPILTTMLLMLVGNTAYPIALRLLLLVTRFVLWGELHQDIRETITYILTYPRRVYTHLFPAAETYWLALVLICLNGTDWALFEALNLGNPAVIEIPIGARVMDGLFQAFSVRATGLIILPIASLKIGLQAVYIIMMYTSVYPIAISIRSTNVSETQPLLIHEVEHCDNCEKGHPASDPAARATSHRSLPFIYNQVRLQLSHDTFFLIAAAVVCIWIETSRFEADPFNFSIFNIVFEVTSAYCNVGLSVGLPDQAYSLCGEFRTASKIVLCVVMMRGHHRGLPVAIDRAIKLPDYTVVEEDANEPSESPINAESRLEGFSGAESQLL